MPLATKEILPHSTVGLKEVYEKLEKERELNKLLNELSTPLVTDHIELRDILRRYKNIIQQLLEENDD